MEDDRFSDRIKTATKSTSDLVNSLGSFRHIVHTIFLIGGIATVGMLGWAGYKYVDVTFRPPINIEEIELLAKSADGYCSLYKKGTSNYLVDYYKGFDSTIDGSLSVIAKFNIYPRNVGKTCSLLKGSKIPTVMQTVDPEPVDPQSIQLIK